jgi:hypothetical protein
MSRWRVVPSTKDLAVRDTDYTASFECHNVDTGAVVKIEFTQDIGQPVQDLVDSLRALSQTFYRAALGELGDEKDRTKMH